MHENKSLRLIRLPDVLDRTGLGRSTLYEKIKMGEFTPSVSLGGRSVAWPEHEVDAIVQSWIAQNGPADESKNIVEMLIINRKV